MRIKMLMAGMMVLLVLSCTLASNFESISDQFGGNRIDDFIGDVIEPILAETDEAIEAEEIAPPESDDPGIGQPPIEILEPTETVDEIDVSSEEDASLIVAANTVIQALHDQDMEAISQLVHPTMGLRFAPYAFILEDYLVFMPEELPGLLDFDHQTVYEWGDFMWTGDPIELTFHDYFYRFVYSAYFIRAEEIGINQKVSPEDMINNSHEFYPGSEFVEYYFSGIKPEFIGLDWQSLRLVFVEENSTWWLVCIVHEEWTG